MRNIIKRKTRKRSVSQKKLERALDLLAQATTVVRDLYCGYRAIECTPHPIDCVHQARKFFSSIGELDPDTRETWSIE
jgi:hypothetical protein